MLVPPDNFGLVEPGVYRCSKLESDHFPFLETLTLKLLIVLDAEKPPRLLKTFLESNNVTLYNLGGLKISNHHHTGVNSIMGRDEDEYDDRGSISSSRRVSANEIEVIKLDDTATGSEKKRSDLWMLIEKNLIHRAFELLLNKNKHNILLVDSTLTLVGILRKMQKWNINSIVNEYRIYTGPSNKSNYYAENFLELVQTELIPYEVDLIYRRQQQQQENILPRVAATLPRLAATLPLLVAQGARSVGGSSSTSTNSDSTIPILYEPTFTDLDDDVDIDEDDELTDDDLLSASPQIPANLLKLAEKRKNEKASRSNLHDEDLDKLGRPRRITPGSSPKHPPALKRNSISNDLFFSSTMGSRRRSSVEMKLRPLTNNNSKFRTPSLATLDSLGSSPKSPSPITTVSGFNIQGSHQIQAAQLNTPSALSSSLPGAGRRASRTREASMEPYTPAEVQRIKDKFEYKYYKNLHKNLVKYDNINVIKIKLPPDEKLPSWFTRSRDMWEARYKQMNC